jgi:hypothetical protein
MAIEVLFIGYKDVLERFEGSLRVGQVNQE